MKTRTKALGGALAALGLAVSLAGCAGEAQSSGDVELTMQVWANANRARTLEATIDAFEKKNPGTTVALEWMDLSAYFDKLNTKFAAGDAPDVFFLTGQWIGEYAERGALLDLAQRPELDLSSVPSGLLDASRLNGALYGVPTGVNAIGLVYNTGIVSAAGLELPDDTTWSWEDFHAFNTAIHDGTGTYGTGYYVPRAPMLSAFARQRGENLYTEDGELGLSAATVRDYFQMTVDMRADGGFAPAGSLEDQGTSVAESPLGRSFIASQVIATNVYPDFNASLDGALALMRLPGESTGMQRGMQVTPSNLWAAAATGRHPAESAALIDFLTNDPDAFAARGTELGVPINPDVVGAVVPTLTDDQRTFVEYVQGLIAEDLPPYFLEPAGAGEVANALLSVATEVEFGRMSPSAAAERFTQTAQQALAAAG